MYPNLEPGSFEQMAFIRARDLWGESIRLCERLGNLRRLHYGSAERMLRLCQRAREREQRRATGYHVTNLAVYGLLVGTTVL